MSDFTGKEKREALLDELENIRNMLNEDEGLSPEELALHQHDLDIPLLVAEESVVTLAQDGIPVLAESVSASALIPILLPDEEDEEAIDPPVLMDETASIETVTTEIVVVDALTVEAAVVETGSTPAPRKNPLEVIRAAAAKVAANAVRYRETSPEMLADMVPFEGISPQQEDADITEVSTHILPEKSRLVADISALQSEIEAVIRKDEPVKKSGVDGQQIDALPARSSADMVRDVLAENIVRGLLKEAMVEDIVRSVMPLLEEQLRKILDEKLQGPADQP